MKYFKSVLVIMLLVGLPAGSWYFLQHGLEWRREKRTELVPKGNLLTDNNWTETQKQSLTALFKDKTSLVTLSNKYTDRELEVVNQFKDAFTFQALNNSNLEVPLNGLYDANYIVIDTSLNVRQKYIGQGEQIITRIVEDIALLLPKQKGRDIKMKNSMEDK